jgi:hypothetical protein
MQAMRMAQAVRGRAPVSDPDDQSEQMLVFAFESHLQ